MGVSRLFGIFPTLVMSRRGADARATFRGAGLVQLVVALAVVTPSLPAGGPDASAVAAARRPWAAWRRVGSAPRENLKHFSPCHIGEESHGEFACLIYFLDSLGGRSVVPPALERLMSSLPTFPRLPLQFRLRGVGAMVVWWW